MEEDWDALLLQASTLTVENEKGQEARYFLCPLQGKTYVLTPGQWDAADYTPVAVYLENADVIGQLTFLTRQQQDRNASRWRVEYPEFKAALTQLFLGDEECVARNETADYDMEEWLTRSTSFYEIDYGAPWWLDGAEEGWYARAMDAGSWYSISIPDHLVPQVQAICAQQALCPSLDTIYSGLEGADTIYYAAMIAMNSRVGIDDPEVIDQIIQLLLTPQGDMAQVSDPGRVMAGEELGILSIPVGENRCITFCLQEVEDGCLLSCTWAEDMWDFGGDTLPVLWTLPAGTAYQIYSIYEDWLSDQGQSASAAAYDWQDDLSFEALSPEEEVLSPASVTVPAGGGGFTYHITYAQASVTLEFGLRAQDGTEYFQRVVGGSLEGTIPDIPAGTYQLFVRNSGDYDFRAPGYVNGDVDYRATGALVFLIQPPST